MEGKKYEGTYADFVNNIGSVDKQQFWKIMQTECQSLFEKIATGTFKNAFKFTGFDIQKMLKKLVSEISGPKKKAYLIAAIFFAVAPGKTTGKRVDRLLGKEMITKMHNELGIKDSEKAGAEDWTSARLAACMHVIIIQIKYMKEFADKLPLGPAANVTIPGQPIDPIWCSQEAPYCFPDMGNPVIEALYGEWIKWGEKHNMAVQNNKEKKTAFNLGIQSQKRRSTMVPPDMILNLLQAWIFHFAKQDPVKYSIALLPSADAIDGTIGFKVVGTGAYAKPVETETKIDF